MAPMVMTTPQPALPTSNGHAMNGTEEMAPGGIDHIDINGLDEESYDEFCNQVITLVSAVYHADINGKVQRAVTLPLLAVPIKFTKYKCLAMKLSDLRLDVLPLHTTATPRTRAKALSTAVVSRERSSEHRAAAMGVTKEGVESTLSTKLQPTYLEVVDTSGGCGASFAIAIVSAAFEGKRLLERHRIVNTALAEEMKDIHALSISKALTPKQWSDQQPAVAQKASEPEVQEQPAAATV